MRSMGKERWCTDGGSGGGDLEDLRGIDVAKSPRDPTYTPTPETKTHTFLLYERSNLRTAATPLILTTRTRAPDFQRVPYTLQLVINTLRV